MGKLGVSQVYSFRKNLAIILVKHDRNGEDLTKKQVTFLIVCWKGHYREIARELKHEYMKFLNQTEKKRAEDIEEAKQFLKSQYVELFISR